MENSKENMHFYIRAEGLILAPTGSDNIWFPLFVQDNRSLDSNWKLNMLTLLRPELSPDNIWRSRQTTTCDVINFYDSRWFL